AITESLRVLRSRGNALAGISYILPEVLATIFTYIVEEETVKIFRGASRCRVPASVIVTHVCRHWSQVALECTTLWAYIDCVSARWSAVMLERSKKAALVI
ncbi:uncharacterized protein EDB91DRAFT_1032968, partial [Suillus paluster]|uniref:uncharacterized protein n=1 Tax=Suillus paluster TaxID=48578 RepID=UPI001B868F3A